MLVKLFWSKYFIVLPLKFKKRMKHEYPPPFALNYNSSMLKT